MPRDQFGVQSVGLGVASKYIGHAWGVKGPYVCANMSNSVEDVGGRGVCGGGMRCQKIFICLQYGNFMVLPQPIPHHHMPYRLCR